jgi:hypothetical protein
VSNNAAARRVEINPAVSLIMGISFRYCNSISIEALNRGKSWNTINGAVKQIGEDKNVSHPRRLAVLSRTAQTHSRPILVL